MEIFVGVWLVSSFLPVVHSSVMLGFRPSHANASVEWFPDMEVPTWRYIENGNNTYMAEPLYNMPLVYLHVSPLLFNYCDTSR